MRADGVLRRWAVHGAAGELTLQVLRRRGGRTVRAGFSQMQRVSDPGRRSFGVDLNVQRGDRIGVLLGPGARVGLRMRPGARAQRWPGIRTPLPPSGTVRGELLLSADVEAGKRAAAPRQLTGARAAAAASGRVLGEAEVEVPETGPVTVRLVRTGRAVALDSFSGRRRLARILVSGADVRGRVADLAGICEYPGAVCLQWLNDADADAGGPRLLTRARRPPVPGDRLSVTFDRREFSASERAEQLGAERHGHPFLLYRDVDRAQRLLQLEGDRLSVGRDPGNDVHLGWDPEASRVHALLERVGGQWTVADDELSRNGTYVNGTRVRGRRRLNDHDVIRFGSTSVYFRDPGGSSGETAPAGGAATMVDVSPAQRRVLLSLCRPLAQPAVAAPPRRTARSRRS